MYDTLIRDGTPCVHEASTAQENKIQIQLPSKQCLEACNVQNSIRLMPFWTLLVLLIPNTIINYAITYTNTFATWYRIYCNLSFMHEVRHFWSLKSLSRIVGAEVGFSFPSLTFDSWLQSVNTLLEDATLLMLRTVVCHWCFI